MFSPVGKTQWITERARFQWIVPVSVSSPSSISINCPENHVFVACTRGRATASAWHKSSLTKRGPTTGWCVPYVRVGELGFSETYVVSVRSAPRLRGFKTRTIQGVVYRLFFFKNYFSNMNVWCPMTKTGISTNYAFLFSKLTIFHLPLPPSGIEAIYTKSITK